MKTQDSTHQKCLFISECLRWMIQTVKKPCLFVLPVTKTDPSDPEIVLLAISIFSEINETRINQIINVAIYLCNRKGIPNKWNNTINSKNEHSVFFSSVQFFCFLLL